MARIRMPCHCKCYQSCAVPKAHVVGQTAVTASQTCTAQSQITCKGSHTVAKHGPTNACQKPFKHQLEAGRSQSKPVKPVKRSRAPAPRRTRAPLLHLCSSPSSWGPAQPASCTWPGTGTAGLQGCHPVRGGEGLVGEVWGWQVKGGRWGEGSGMPRPFVRDFECGAVGCCWVKGGVAAQGDQPPPPSPDWLHRTPVALPLQGDCTCSPHPLHHFQVPVPPIPAYPKPLPPSRHGKPFHNTSRKPPLPCLPQNTAKHTAKHRSLATYPESLGSHLTQSPDTCISEQIHHMLGIRNSVGFGFRVQGLGFRIYTQHIKPWDLNDPPPAAPTPAWPAPP